MKNLNFKILSYSIYISLCSLGSNLLAQNVFIPDPSFKAALVANTNINTNLDNEIQITEASAFNGTINVDALGINNLTGIESFVNLTQLFCRNNQLTNLNVSANIALTSLYCGYNQLNSLDLSNLNSLLYLDALFNNLSYLNFQNGNNANIQDFDVTSNPNLNCILVDDLVYMNANWTGYIDATASFSLSCAPCTVNIPDANFKALLLNNNAINTNSNSEIECNEATNYSGTINAGGYNIADLTGIEAFVNITQLECYNNQLTSLNLTNNTALTIIDCGLNQLSSLNLALNANLISVNCANNNISNLNSLPTDLQYLYCENNLISNLDVSNLNSLITLHCYNNQLQSLNMQNGNNSNLTSFYAYGNPQLLCIQVDDAVYMTSNHAGDVDTSANFSENCSPCVIFIPDANFKTALLANPYINTNANQEVECSEASAFSGSIFVLNSNISDLTGIEAFTGVTQLNCSMNQLTSLDLSANTALYFIDANNNQLTNFILPTGSTLSDVIVSDNQLASIDFNSNSYLNYVDCNNNNLTNLNVLSNSYLGYLFCNGNQISDLDCSNNSSLFQLGCANNLLSNLNLQNGNNSNLTSFDATNNPQLTCVQVDSVALMNTNWSGAIDATASYSLACTSCTIAIPDVNFKNALLANLNINTNADNEIQCAEANNYNGIIQLIGLGIADLTGIEAFFNITELNCAQNLLTGNLNLSNNTLLTYLNCSENQITDLNVSACTSLYELICTQNLITGTIDVNSLSNLYNFRCEYNQLTSIDVSNNTNLYSFGCGSNQLTNLDVSNNVALVHLEFEYNQISNININNNILLGQLICSYNLLGNIDVSNNGNLEVLYCDFNQLSGINITNCTLLEFFNCSDNMLTSVNVSNNLLLNMLYCSFNQINGQLDLSNHSALAVLNCSDNNLNSLNIQNGNNIFLSFFDARQNPDLTCIQVDSVPLMNNNWSGAIDATAIYSFACAACVVNIPDVNFKNALLANTLVNTNSDNEIQCSEATAFSGALNVSNLNIADITGIEAFINLTAFDCSYNQLTYFYLNIPTLTTLNCSHNNLYNHLVYCASDFNLDISYNFFTSVSYSELATFNCSNNTITSIDVTACPNLTALNCSNNLITSANLSYNTNLSQIDCSNNLLNSLNVQNGNNTNLSYFNALNNPNLNCIQVDNTNFMNTNWFAAKDPIASYSSNCSGNFCQSIPIAFSANNTNISVTPMVATFTNATPNSSNYQFVWYFGDGTFEQSNAPTINHTYTYNGVYSVSLLAIDIASGCTDTSYFPNYITCNSSGALSCNHTVNINPSGNINACTGSPVPLSGTTNLSYYNAQWNRNGVAIGGASQDQYMALLSGNYSLTISDMQGCPITSSLVQINYNLPSSNPPIISANGPTGNCGNVNVILTASGAFTNYLWSNGQTGNSITVNQGGTYTVTGQSPACDAVSVPFDISGSNAPVPPVCMITVDETDNKNIVIWEKPISMEINSFLILREDIDSPNIFIEIDEVGYTELSEYKDVSADANERAYRYKLAVKDNCGGISISSSAQRSMHLNVTKGNNILARQLNWNVYQGQPQTFNYYLIYRETVAGNLNLVLIDSVPSSQIWYNDNSLTSLNDTLRAYMIAYRITSPCVSSRAVNELCQSNVTNAAFVIDGMNALKAPNFKWSVIPNPNNGKFIIEIPNNTLAQIKIYNLLGELNYSLQISNHQTSIDLSNLNNGVYLVSINNGTQISTKRLIISK